MKTFLRCFLLACLFCGCMELTMPTEYTLVLCLVDGDTLIVGADVIQTLECANLDSLVVSTEP